jgi:hypothetical protein
VLAPTDPVVIGALYMLRDDETRWGAIVRMRGASPDFWVVDEFVPNAPLRRRRLPRRRWQARASIDIT